MPLTRIRLIEVSLVGSCLIVVAAAYMNSRVTAARADAEHKANQVLQSQLETMKADYDKQIAERKAETLSELKILDQKFAEAKKDQAKALALISQIGKLPVPVTVTTLPATKENPNPQPVAIVPKQDFAIAMEYGKECEACKAVEKQIQKDLQDRQHQLEIATQQIEQLKKENNEVRKTVKGSFFGNLKKSAKLIVIGAGVGAAAVCGSGHCK
jgi:hypothetical protein